MKHFKILTTLMLLFVIAFPICTAFVFCEEDKKESLQEKQPLLQKLEIVIDEKIADKGSIQDFVKKSTENVTIWYPKIAEMLQSEGFTPPTEVKLVFQKMDGIAGASGNTIWISVDWIQQHPDDLGMVIHELVHVIQAYPNPTGPGWITEGIADYIRCFHFEPDAPMPKIDPEKASYRDAYKTTAAFFHWIEKKYDKEFVTRLNVQMRQQKYKKTFFSEVTGKSVDELWAEYVKECSKNME